MPCPTVERFLELCFSRKPAITWVGFDYADPEDNRIRIRLEKESLIKSLAGFLWVTVPVEKKGDREFGARAGWWLNEAFRLGPDHWREAFDDPACPEELTAWAGVTPTQPKIPREAPCTVTYNGTPFTFKGFGGGHYSTSSYHEEETPFTVTSVCPKCGTLATGSAHPMFILAGFNMDRFYHFCCQNTDCEWSWKCPVRVTLAIEAIHGS